jgi:hypothetical protein
MLTSSKFHFWVGLIFMWVVFSMGRQETILDQILFGISVLGLILSNFYEGYCYRKEKEDAKS